MNFFVAITDLDWFQLHAAKPYIDEVNFWLPSSDASFKALRMGEPFLFKLHSPRNYVVGGGFFTKYVQLPVSLAWDAFGEGNGARTLEEVKQRISKYRHTPISPFDDPHIGCIILAEAFFFREDQWIPCPPSFARSIIVSRRIREEFENGRDYYQLHGRIIARPSEPLAAPSTDSLRFHAETVFR